MENIINWNVGSSRVYWEYFRNHRRCKNEKENSFFFQMHTIADAWYNTLYTDYDKISIH